MHETENSPLPPTREAWSRQLEEFRGEGVIVELASKEALVEIMSAPEAAETGIHCRAGPDRPDGRYPLPIVSQARVFEGCLFAISWTCLGLHLLDSESTRYKLGEYL